MSYSFLTNIVYTNVIFPEKIGWEYVVRFPKPLPYLLSKSAIFPTLFMTLPKIRYPIYTYLAHIKEYPPGECLPMFDGAAFMFQRDIAFISSSFLSARV